MCKPKPSISLIFNVSSFSAICEIFFFAIVVQNSLHFFNGSSILVLEYILSSLSDLFFEHKLILAEKELQPASLSFILNLNTHILVDSIILVLNESNEFLGLVVELVFPSEGLSKLEDLL